MKNKRKCQKGVSSILAYSQGAPGQQFIATLKPREAKVAAVGKSATVAENGQKTASRQCGQALTAMMLSMPETEARVHIRSGLYNSLGLHHSVYQGARCDR